MLKLKLLLFFTLLGSLCEAQTQSINSIILDTIVNDDVFRWEGDENLKKTYTIDSLGQQTLHIERKGNLQTRQKLIPNLILIDTFGFFQANNYKGELKVYNSLPTKINSKAPNVFWVNGIATGRNQALAISIFQAGSNFQKVFYFSIMGKEINVIKRESGSF